jgi:hypothetical protein
MLDLSYAILMFMDEKIGRFREQLKVPAKGEHIYEYHLDPPGKRDESHCLLKRTYRDKGFWNGEEDDNLHFHRKESTVCFSIHKDGELSGTISLFDDGSEGLPLDCLYGKNIDPLRREGKVLVEAGALVIVTRDSHILFSLSKLVHNYSFFNRGADYMMLTVHPRHSRFYRALLCMDVAGEEKPHPSVNGSPAVLLSMNLRKAAEEMERVYPRDPSDRDLYRYYYREQPEDFPRAVFGGGQQEIKEG